MKQTQRFSMLLACCVLLVGSLTSEAVAKPKYGNQKGYSQTKNYRTSPHGSLRVPPGHLPPAGYCRYWYPERPPGRQPASFPCSERLYRSYRVPDGAQLLYTPISDPSSVRVLVYERRSPEERVGRAVIQIFEALTGKLIREIS